MVNNADKFAKCNDGKQDICHDAFICVSDRSSLEMVGRTVKMRENSEQGRQEVRQACTKEIVETLTDSADGSAQIAHGVIGTNAVERRNYPSRTREEDREGGARIGATFQEWHEHWVRQESQDQERPLACFEFRKHEEVVPLFKAERVA